MSAVTCQCFSVDGHGFITHSLSQAFHHVAPTCAAHTWHTCSVSLRRTELDVACTLFYRRIFNVSYAARTKSGRDRAPFSQWRRRALKLRTFTIVVELEVSKIALQLVVIHFTVQLLLR